jgi:predicted enzyme related to lactoylglutathione lyase
VRASTGDPPDVEPSLRDWLWWELWCHDIDAAGKLYAQLAGYEFETVEHEGHPYHVLRDGDRPRAGIVKAPPDIPALWLPYIRVEDPEATATLALSLGARVFSQTAERAILIDPTGAPIGIQTWDGRRASAEGREEAR